MVRDGLKQRTSVSIQNQKMTNQVYVGCVQRGKLSSFKKKCLSKNPEDQAED